MRHLSVEKHAFAQFPLTGVAEEEFKCDNFTLIVYTVTQSPFVNTADEDAKCDEIMRNLMREESLPDAVTETIAAAQLEWDHNHQ